MAAKPRELAEPEVATEELTRHAPRYRVLVHNDDVTPFAFVLGILIAIFALSRERALEVTDEAHHHGLAFVGVFSLEEAEHRCDQAHSLARGRGFPLTFTYEPER